MANANSKAIRAIFYGVSTNEFYKISHVQTTKEAWKILETTYEGTNKVNDIKLQILTTHFEEVKIGKDESFGSFFSRLKEIVNAKLNLGEKIDDNKVVRKVLRSLPKSFSAKVTTIKESRDHDSINIQELVRSLQIYELGLPSHKYGNSLALKTINEKVEESSNEDDVEKEVAYLAKNFRKFLKMKSKGKSFDKGRSSSFKKDFNKDDKDKKEPKLIYLVLFCCVLLCFE